MTLDRAQIERLVPHAGAMCLLDDVSEWDARSIRCGSAGPGAQHPLARDGAVPSIAACEYAAQAAAVHGALLDGAGQSRSGMLAKLTQVELHGSRFRGGGPINVHAELLSRVPEGCLYAFDVDSSGHPVASGRLMVSFANADSP
jgi:predicted hotdog family 3-hydroxylacyl-ACP dehydratase